MILNKNVLHFVNNDNNKQYVSIIYCQILAIYVISFSFQSLLKMSREHFFLRILLEI